MKLGDAALHERAVQLSERLRERGETLTTAESCTGGWIAKLITDLAGSSAVFTDGFVTYSNQAKARRLGVDETVLADHGAVSDAVVRAMAEGARRASGSTWSVAVSGVAGPGGGSVAKPVGTVWIGWCGPDGQARARLHRFSGNRDTVRRATVAAALDGLIEQVGAAPG